MKYALAVLLTFSVAPGFAAGGQCYQSKNNWTVTIADQATYNGEDPWVVWKHGKKTTELYSVSCGTGCEDRPLIDEAGRVYQLDFKGDNLIFEKRLYKPGCSV